MKNAFVQLFNNIANLFKVKTILSIGVIATTCYLTITGMVDTATFMTIASAIITYYFTRKDKED